MITPYARKAGALAGCFFLLLGLAGAPTAQAQTSATLSGTVRDSKGAPVPGATVTVKGGTTGTVADESGRFTLRNVDAGVVTLTVSSVGFAAKDLAVLPAQRDTPLTVNLADQSQQVDEVVVTGVFDKRARMDASIAISTLSANQIEVQAPISAAELLKSVPGVYVNSASGEIRNTVYSRGVSAGSVEAATGYYYVSMQEDGLPVTNATFGNYGPDFFLRADATTARLEAVRGGSAAITGPNAPGGIFNYVSKTGGDQLSGEVRTRFGLEGDAQPYYRADVNLGGKLTNKGDLTFNVGGFYRYANSARNPGYALNRGGQGKFNVVKTYAGGALKLYGKYLDDHNNSFDFLPATNFDKPGLAAGVHNTDSYQLSKTAAFDYPRNAAGDQHSFDPARLVHSIDRAVGLDWQHDLGGGWSFQNNVKYTNKRREWNLGLGTAPMSLLDIYPYYVIGGLGKFGTYTFRDQQTGRTVATVVQSPRIVNNQFAGFNFTNVATGELPGQNIQPSSVLFTALIHNDLRMQEVLDQGSVTKKFGDVLTVTAGTYVGVSQLDYTTGLAGMNLATIEDQPHQLDISAVGLDGKTYQFTNPQGVAALGSTLGAGFNHNDFRQTQLSGFGAVTWKIVPQLTFDGGLRCDYVRVKGTNLTGATDPAQAAPGYGGVDGNPLTVYDNQFGRAGTTPLALDHTVKTVSFSGALNYRFSPGLAVYARYADGRKAPDLGLYLNANTAYTAATLDPKAQHVQQVEAGFKLQQGRYNVFVTPFYSLLSNVPSYVATLAADNTLYNTPAIFNSIETYGLELETTYSLTDHFSVRAVGTLQKATAKSWGVWLVGNPGAADDKVQDYSGNRADNVPNLMLNVTPTYTVNKFFAFGNYRYMGNRAANVANTFLLPGFSQVDVGAGFNFTRQLSLQANVNNLFDSQGVMAFQAPGGYPASMDRQGFTPDKLAANPAATFGILSVQPRAYYLSAIYRF